MASLTAGPSGTLTVQFTMPDGRRPKVRLGRMNKKAAEVFNARVGQLVTALKLGVPADPEAAAWLAGLGDELHARVAATGLVPGRESAALGAFLDAYLARRRAGRVKGGTMTNLVTVTNDVRRFFGESAAVRGVGPGGGRRLQGPPARPRTPARRGHRVPPADDGPQRLQAGRPARADRRQPVRDVAGPSTVPADRERHVSVADAERVTAGCDPAFRLVFALARFAGLRCPSEVLSLKWSDINWDAGTRTVLSPKTEHRPGGAYRVCPVFARLRPYL